MLELKNLSKSYKHGKDYITVLKDINIKLNDSGFVSILGKSGSGKSSLLNIIGGLDRYDDGEIILNGKSTKDFTQNDWDSYRNTYIGFIFQEFYMIDRMTVGENIALALELQGLKKEEIKMKVRSILIDVELSGYENRKISEISGGEKQRVAIARALVKNPKVILADEPTGNLDSATSKGILEILKKLSKERLIIMVTHDTEFANAYGERIIELKDGKIIKDENKTVLDNKLDNEFHINKSKLPFSAGFKFAINSLFTKKIRLILMLFLFACSLMFVTVALTYAFFNVDEASILTFEKAGVKEIPLLKSNNFNNLNDILPFTDSDINYLKSTYQSITFVKSIQQSNLLHFNFEPKFQYDSTSFNKATIINEQNEKYYPLLYGTYPSNTGDIMITDYMADLIIKYNLFDEVQTEQDLIGFQIQQTQNTPVLTITGIVKTDYKQYYNKLLNNPHSAPSIGFTVNEDEIYRQLFMSQITFNSDFNQISTLLVKDNKANTLSNFDIHDYSQQYNDQLIGRLPSGDNEIVITATQMWTFIDPSINPFKLSESDMEKYLDSTITLNLSEYGLGKEQFKLTGILNDTSSQLDFSLMFNQSRYNYFSYNYPGKVGDYGNKMMLTAFLGSNKAENTAFIKNLPDNIRHDTFYSSELYSEQEVQQSSIHIILYLAAALTGFTIIMIFTFMTTTIAAKQKEIGILKALGARGKDLFKIFSIETVLIVIISNLISGILTAFAINMQNTQIKENFNLNININILYLNYISIFAVLGLSIVIISVSTLAPILKITLMKPIQAIRKAN